MTYTAQQVRALANKMLDWSSVDDEAYADEQAAHAMLREYADRLEQDEQHLRSEPMPKGLVYGGMKYEVWRPDQEVRVTVEESEPYRRGKLEVYREILTISPLAEMGGNLYCVFCGSDAHAPDCLLERATAALRETTPTP